ncbi:MAG: rhomboid family intramembrane serine protease [Polyangiaceae bacterium]|nr:rhomboid family intramembrane serine protease [Polyangiaceae bacterium]
MILPLTHDSSTSRRWPVVTIFVLLACFAVHVVVSMAARARDDAVRELVRQGFELQQRHPGLEDPLPNDEIFRPGSPEEALRLVPESRPDILDPGRREPQERLDSLVREIVRIRASTPERRFGYIPDRGGVLQLFTYAFLHGGWMHLIFNAWFLWLCGCNMEDRWGRGVYAGFYLAAAAVAALAHGLWSGGGVPMIGASGAVAGAMGAFMVVHARTRIRFLTFIMMRPLLFTAPAYVMLPLWVGAEILEAVSGARDGVAHMAHVGGFVFGAAVALVLRLTGMEKKLDDAVERTVTVSQDPRLLEAGGLIDQGRAGEAIAMLEAMAVEAPLDIDVALALLRAAGAAGDAGREIAAYGKLMDLYVRAGAPGTAMDLYLEVRQKGREQELPALNRLFFADRLARIDRLEDAAMVYSGIHGRGAADEAGLRALLGHARVEAKLGRIDAARRFLDEVRGSPLSTPELGALAARELSRLPG